MTGYKLVGGTFRTDLDTAFSVGDGCEDIDECEVAADNSTGTGWLSFRCKYNVNSYFIIPSPQNRSLMC